jgi:hypothetical protein
MFSTGSAPRLHKENTSRAAVRTVSSSAEWSEVPGWLVRDFSCQLEVNL